jgi:DNA repair exonuclease SbcCD ATPase subunit
MLVLKALTFNNIGRFTTEQTIGFTQLGSLVQIEGQNNCTGGSSGAGKSTVFKALEFLLGLNDISNGVLQSRLTKEPMLVTGLFELDGQPLKIERGKKLLIDLNGEVTTGSSKLTEEKLDEIIGMPRDLFRKVMHKRQGEGGFFLDMGPSQVHAFLTSCLGLDKEQAKIVTLDIRLNTLQTNQSSALTIIESNKSGLEASLSAISMLGLPPTLDISQDTLQELKTKHLGAIDTHQLVKNGHKKEIEDFEKTRPQVESTPFDRSNIVQLENEIGTILAQIAELEKVEQDRQSQIKSKISDLQTEANRLSHNEQCRQYEVKNKISALRLEISKIEQLERTRYTEVQSKINRNRLQSVEYRAAVKEGDNAKAEAAKLVQELQKVRASLCPTCDQGWVNQAAKDKESSILAKLQEYKRSVIAGMEASNRILALEEEKKQLEIEALPRSYPGMGDVLEQSKQLEMESQPRPIPEIDVILGNIALLQVDSQPQAIPEAIELKLKKDFKSKELLTIRQEEKDHQFNVDAKNTLMVSLYASKQTELRKKHETTIKFVQDEENKALSEYEAAKNKMASFEDAKKRFEGSLAKLQDQVSRYQAGLDTKNAELVLIQEEIELAEESKKAIKSYLSCSFEDALDSIGDMATRLIRSIPNMQTSTIQFEGLKETSSGKIKEEVVCLISMDGEIGVPVRSLSGGERSSIDNGIDLSVVRFIEERTGKGIDLMILDEFTNGMDTTCIENALEMLKAYSVDKRLLIVEHNPVVSQSIENRLTVVRDGLTSKIVQQ